MNRWERVEGTPFPQGASWLEEERAFKFSLYSKHASAIRLLMYNKSDVVHPVFEQRDHSVEQLSQLFTAFTRRNGTVGTTNPVKPAFRMLV